MAKEDMMALEDIGAEMEMEDEGESEAMANATAIDEELDSMTEEVSPVGAYSVRSLNVLGDSINKVLPLFDATLPPVAPFQGDVKGKLPLELVKPLVMINKAAEDAMLPDLAPSIEGLVDNRGLEMAAGKVTLLGKNRDFQMFLKSAPKETEAPETEVEVKVETPAVGMSPEEEDKLMMERMS